MIFEVRPYDRSTVASRLLNRQLDEKCIRPNLPSRPKKGVFLERTGYLCRIVFSFEHEGGLQNGYLQLSQKEAFMIARMFQDGKSDDEFVSQLLGRNVSLSDSAAT
jgi:hypothetical protein